MHACARYRAYVNLQGCDIDLRKLRRGQPPVMLLGGLTQIWPLGFATIPVILATADTHEPALASRYLCGRCLLPVNDKTATLARLLELGAWLQQITGVKSPLFCGNDHDLALTQEFHAQLSDVFLLFDNDPALNLALINKDRFQALARTHDLPVPRLYGWDDDSPDPVRHATRAVIAKPRSKEMWSHSPLFRRLFPAPAKAKVFADGAALLACPGLAEIKDHLIIQDYIPGGDERIHSFHGLADRGELLAWFLGRKIRTFPKNTGESAFIELIKDDDLAAIGRDITQRLQLRGVFKMDFKRDTRDGRFYLLEINARFSLWHHLGAVNGINIPQAAYDYIVHGVRRPNPEYATRYRWQNFGYDYHAYRELRELREITFWGWLRSLLQAKRVQDLFFWKDPFPYLQWTFLRFYNKLNKWRATAS